MKLPDPNKFIAIGKIVKPIGIKGNLKVIYLTDFPDRFNDLEKVFLFDEIKNSFYSDKGSSGFEFVISEQKSFDKYLNIKFEGYDSINEINEFINLIIMIDEKDRVKIDKGSFYFYELVGSEFYDKGILIGKVKSVVNYGSGDLFNIDTDGREILIPFLKEFIVNIDIKKKRIDADLIDGFIN